MSRPDKQRATVICQQQDKFLLVRKADAKWSLPGGRIEAREGPGQAAERELNEETGLAAELLEFLALHRIASCAHHVFRARIDDTQAAVPQNEIADCRWFTFEEASATDVKKPSRELLRLYAGAAPLPG